MPSERVTFECKVIIHFPMDGKYMAPEDHNSLTRPFNELEEQKTSKGDHERFHRMMHEV